MHIQRPRRRSIGRRHWQPADHRQPECRRKPERRHRALLLPWHRRQGRQHATDPAKPGRPRLRRRKLDCQRRHGWHPVRRQRRAAGGCDRRVEQLTICRGSRPASRTCRPGSTTRRSPRRYLTTCLMPPDRKLARTAPRSPACPRNEPYRSGRTHDDVQAMICRCYRLLSLRT